MSVVLNVKVVGPIMPPLVQMAFTEAYYKFGLNTPMHSDLPTGDSSYLYSHCMQSLLVFSIGQLQHTSREKGLVKS